MRRSVWILLGGLWLAGALRYTAAEDAAVDATRFPQESIRYFEQEVRPILVAHCYKCHGTVDTPKGGLRLTSRAGLLRGGDTGPAVTLDDPAGSLLLEAVNYESYEMPPNGPLPEAQIRALTRWIELGLPWTPGEEPEFVTDEAMAGPPQVTPEAKRFWSFQPVRRPQLPEVADVDWVRNPIDRFIRRRLEEAGLRPARPAGKVELVRRAYYDLTGLPPAPDDVAAFVNDEAADAYQRLVDRLLDSPHYGERWARHWLDLVRYAESNSYERDGAKPFVWRYRDYVIRALNEDKPYDRFILEQLAGDELQPATRASVIATGYYRLGVWQDEPVDPEQELFEDLDDLVRTTGEVFLGLTIGCARCHDHKLDPLPQRDYYRFLAFFRNVRRYGVRAPETVLDASVRTIATSDERRAHREAVRAYRAAVDANTSALDEMEAKLSQDLQGVERDDWKTESARIDIARRRVGQLLSEDEFAEYVKRSRRRDQLRRSRPPGLDQALSVKEHGPEAPTTYVLARGNVHAPGEEVHPGFPEVLSPPEPEILLPGADVPSTGRRLALARWIASPHNPLTARVMVNRVWQHHFGRGIVATSSDFGFQGAAPTHGALLDWLASEFVASGWRLKTLHRQIMLSNTYRMSSHAAPDALARDPENVLLGRFEMRRLSAEEIRDSILAVNGRLNRERMYGPSVYTKIPQEVLAGQSQPGSGWGESSPDDRARRSIYVHVKRSLIVPLIASFDGADTDFSCPVRFQTTQPTQALGMLNSAFVHEQAEVFADDLRACAGTDPAAQVYLGLARVMQRPPRDEEVDRGLRSLRALQQQHALSDRVALKQFCVTLLNLNEFIYLD